MLLASSRGVVAIHDGFVKFSRTLPVKALPRLFVMTLITLPLNRPYSPKSRRSGRSSHKSRPRRKSVGCAEQVVVDVDAVQQEDVRHAKPPEIVTWLALGVLFVSPVRARRQSCGRRVPGNMSRSRLRVRLAGRNGCERAGRRRGHRDHLGSGREPHDAAHFGDAAEPTTPSIAADWKLSRRKRTVYTPGGKPLTR